MCIRDSPGDNHLADVEDHGVELHPASMAHSVPGTECAMLCLLYTSDAADERSSVDLGGRRILKKKKNDKYAVEDVVTYDTYINSDITTIWQEEQ